MNHHYSNPTSLKTFGLTLLFLLAISLFALHMAGYPVLDYFTAIYKGLTTPIYLL